MKETYSDLIGFPKMIVDYGITVAYVFFGVALLLVIFFPTLQMIRNLKGAVKTLASIGIIALIFLLCYSISVAEPTMGPKDEMISGGTMKLVEAWIYMVYIMLGGAILAVVITPLSRYLKL